MCIAHVICPVGALFCAMAWRDGHPRQVAHPTMPRRVCWRNHRRDHTLCPWGPDIIPVPPSGSRSRVTMIACLPSRGAISVEREDSTAIARVLRTFTGCLHIVGGLVHELPSGT